MVSVVESALSDTVALVDPSLSPYCAGVITSSLVVTAEHCVSGKDVVMIAERLGSEQITNPRPYEILYSDPIQDLAILRPTEAQLKEGRLLAPYAPDWGDRVVLVGHPQGLAWSVGAGVVSNPRRVNGNGMVWMQVDSDVTYGNSGGPAFNSYGEVVGIVSFMAFGERHLAGVVHWSEVKAALAKVVDQ